MVAALMASTVPPSFVTDRGFGQRCTREVVGGASAPEPLLHLVAVEGFGVS